MRTLKKYKYVALGAVLLMNTACSGMGILTGVGAAAGLTTAKEGSVKVAAQDFVIATKVNDAWFKYDVNTFGKLNLSVENGRVLVTGVVQDPQHRLEAIRLVWQVEGVKQVINEIRVAESEGMEGFISDTWLTARLRTMMTLDKKIGSINYSIETVQGTIYLMGVALDSEERNYVIERTRTTRGVKNVVSYIRLAGEGV